MTITKPYLKEIFDSVIQQSWSNKESKPAVTVPTPGGGGSIMFLIKKHPSNSRDQKGPIKPAP